MTKYILHGGETGIPNKHNEAFYQEWVKDFESNFIPTILLVYFSRDKQEWNKLEQQDKERFVKYTNNRLVNFLVASDNIEIFEEQIKKSNTIYFRGGFPELAMKVLLPIKDKLLNMMDDKIYAGSSAGVMILSHSTRSNTTDWQEGLGLLPINSFVHWSGEFQENLNSFKEKNHDNKFDYLLIPETEFMIKNY